MLAVSAMRSITPSAALAGSSRSTPPLSPLCRALSARQWRHQWSPTVTFTAFTATSSARRLCRLSWSLLAGGARARCPPPPTAAGAAARAFSTTTTAGAAGERAGGGRGADQQSRTALTVANYFQSENKNRETFLEAIDIFIESSVHRRGLVDFILAALQQMKTYGVQRDIEVYRKLLDLFPVGPLKTTNVANLIVPIHPRHQDCAVTLLHQMEVHKVMPDVKIRNSLLKTFGKMSLPVRRLARMFYWMPKFRHLSPWPLPLQLPTNQLQLAQLAAARLASGDPRAQLVVYSDSDMPANTAAGGGGGGDTGDCGSWIVSCESEQQRQLLQHHPLEQPLLLEGAFRLWLHDQCVSYFVLRAEPLPCDAGLSEGFDQDNLMLLENWVWQDRLPKAVKTKADKTVVAEEMKKEEETTDAASSSCDKETPLSATTAAAPASATATGDPYLGQTFSSYERGWFLRDTRPPCRYRQEDGTIMGMCITASSSSESLLSWLHQLQRQCPRLADIPVIFPAGSPLGHVTPLHQPQLTATDTDEVTDEQSRDQQS